MAFAVLSLFISKDESDLPSRTNEVVRCEERLLASCRGENTSLPSFLIHSFDEVGINKGLATVASVTILQYHWRQVLYQSIQTASSPVARAKIKGLMILSSDYCISSFLKLRLWAKIDGVLRHMDCHIENSAPSLKFFAL